MNTQARPSPLGIFGGTFDPVHNGHLTIAGRLGKYLSLEALHMVPCKIPPHRDNPHASDEQRLAMLHLATEDMEDIVIDARELQNNRISYTVDTLKSFRDESGADVSLVLCMGADAFASLHTWHHWEQILELAHITVATRPGTGNSLAGSLRALLSECHTEIPDDLNSRPSGLIHMANLGEIAVSSSEVRKILFSGHPDLASLSTLLPSNVLEYIQRYNVYPVSS
jgi:nicotinate-nucleotide adenylyltransferase